MELFVLVALVGIAMVVSGISARLRPVDASPPAPLSPAKLADGRPVPPPVPVGQRGSVAGTVRIVLGTLVLLAVGTLFWLAHLIPHFS